MGLPRGHSRSRWLGSRYVGECCSRVVQPARHHYVARPFGLGYLGVPLPGGFAQAGVLDVPLLAFSH